MGLVIYALQFQGQSTIEGVDGNVLRTATRARGGMHFPPYLADDLAGVFAPDVSGEARQELELTFTGATTFQLVGSITFGTGVHQVHIHTAGSGYLNRPAGDGCMYGAVISWIEEGAGQFAGANGLLTSNFIVTESGEVTDYHLGVVQVR